MSLKNQPLQPRSNDIHYSEVWKHIHDFIEFFGIDAVAKALRDLDKTLRHHGRFYRMWMQQVQPWLFTLRRCAKIGEGNVPSWPKEIQQFAGDAFMIVALAKKMPEAVKEKYRKDLLGNQHSDFIFEINTAWHYYLQGYDVEWYPLGHDKAPEFRVRGGGLDFDVECRRFTLDIGQRIKMEPLASMCDMMDSVLQQCSRWGEVTVIYSDNLQFEPSQVHLWKQAFQRAVISDETQLQLNDGPPSDPETRKFPECEVCRGRTYEICH